MKQLLFNIKMDILNYDEALAFCIDTLNNNKCRLIYFINAHCFNIAQRDSKYREALNSVDLLLNDGIGIELASKMANIRVKENMNGTDFIPRVLEYANLNKYKIYLLGGNGKVPEIAKEKLKEIYNNIEIVGTHDGYFNKDEEISIIQEINDKKAEIVIVGMGVPKQELWLYENKDKFTNLRLCIAGGAILDFISGNVKRAPEFIRKIKLEWAYRLFKEPKRLWKRYVIGNILFLSYVALFKIHIKK